MSQNLKTIPILHKQIKTQEMKISPCINHSSMATFKDTLVSWFG